jgi:electron transport complex protein RnfE
MSLLREFTKGLFKDNPIFVLVLGLCPTLAVTTAVINGVYMAVAATAVLVCSNVIISLIRSFVPKEIRIPCYIVVIASFVTMAEIVMKGFAPPKINAALSIFVPLIVVNCIIMGRAEAFASRNRVAASLADGLGIGGGFLLALLLISGIREFLGSGTLVGYPVFPAAVGFRSLSLMVMAPGAFLVLGLILGFFNQLKISRARKGLR